MEYTGQTDCSYNCGNVYLLTFVLAVFFLWLAPVGLGHRLASPSPSPLPHFSETIPTELQNIPGGEGSAEEYALFLQWLEYHRRTGKHPPGDLLLSPKPLLKSPHPPCYSRPPSPSPSPYLSPSPPFCPSPSPQLPPTLPSIKSEVSPTPPLPPLPTPLSLPPPKPSLRFAPGTLVLRRRPSSDFFDAQDRQHPTDGPFMLLRTHPFSPTTWQLDIPTGSRMPLWHPEVSLVRWDEGVKEIRCSRETSGGREVRVHIKGWGCEDDVWVREDDAWLAEGEVVYRSSL